MLKDRQGPSANVPIEGQSRLVNDLTEAAQLGRDSFIEFLCHRLAFASSDYLSPDIEDHYFDFEDTSAGMIEETQALVYAGLGVYLFCHYAERWGSSRNPTDHRSRAAALLSNPLVRDLLFDLYELDGSYRDDVVDLHETGTTSFILHFYSKGLAVKIIKPWYFDDDYISQQTQSYKDSYGFLQFVIPDHFARIHASNRYCIVMEFIDGITLRAFFQSKRFEAISPSNEPPSANSLVSVLTRICALLSQCSLHIRPTNHGDLSTTNILIRPATGELFLIDFGANYLLSRPVGTAVQRGEVSYLLNASEYEQAASGDMYRLGIILAEGLLRDDFSDEGLQTILDRVYRRYLRMGYFLDGLFWRISTRGFTPEFPTTTMYEAVSDQIEAEFAALARSLETSQRRKLGIVDDISLIVSPINVTQTVERLWELLDAGVRGRPRIENAPTRLRNCTWVPVLINWCVIALFSIIVVSHVNEGLWPEIIGWACTLSYSIIAARYCVFVFSDLDVSDWPGWAKTSVPATCVLIWPPILIPLLVNWSWWAICVAIGTAVIAVNNHVCIRSCKAMNRLIVKSERDTSRVMASALNHLVNWRFLMAIFSGSVFAISLLLWRDLLHDGLFYGVIVAAAPAGKMYHQQTGKEAPIVHAGLHRLANAYRQSVTSGMNGVESETEAVDRERSRL